MKPGQNIPRITTYSVIMMLTMSMGCQPIHRAYGTCAGQTYLDMPPSIEHSPHLHVDIMDPRLLHVVNLHGTNVAHLDPAVEHACHQV